MYNFAFSSTKLSGFENAEEMENGDFVSCYQRLKNGICVLN